MSSFLFKAAKSKLDKIIADKTIKTAIPISIHRCSCQGSRASKLVQLSDIFFDRELAAVLGT